MTNVIANLMCGIGYNSRFGVHGLGFKGFRFRVYPPSNPKLSFPMLSGTVQLTLGFWVGFRV